MGITDGTNQMLLGFAFLGKKGKKGNYGMRDKELKRRFTKEQNKEAAVQERINEYSISKIDLMILMIKRGIGKDIHFYYVLTDSWFTCGAIIKFI